MCKEHEYLFATNNTLYNFLVSSNLLPRIKYFFYTKRRQKVVQKAVYLWQKGTAEKHSGVHTRRHSVELGANGMKLNRSGAVYEPTVVKWWFDHTDHMLSSTKTSCNGGVTQSLYNVKCMFRSYFIHSYRQSQHSRSLSIALFFKLLFPSAPTALPYFLNYPATTGMTYL